MSYILPPIPNKYLSKKKEPTPIWPIIVLFFLQLRLVLQERLQDLFFNPNPYISQYSLRTTLEHKQIRERLKIDPKDCDHTKGGKRVRAFGLLHKDYNVSFFKFINGVCRIRCNSCGKKWFEDQPGWIEALKMVEQSSNRPSTSEIVPFKEGDQFKNRGDL